MNANDFCPECGVAVDVRLEGGRAIPVCRNPQCGRFGQAADDSFRKEDTENG